MRRYDDAVEVRRGRLPGADLEGPEQFLWRGRLWKVRAVVAHSVETGAWWSRSEGRPDGRADASAAERVSVGELLAEREVWRVEAGRGRPDLLGADPGNPADPDDADVTGVFDLAFDWSDGRWQLVGCVD